MKTLPLMIILVSIGITSTRALSPIPHHPDQPPVDIIRAITIASLHLRMAGEESGYCSYAVLNDESMSPAPQGSPRHWELHFLKAGDERSVVRRIYISMNGKASDTVPSR